MRQYARFKKAHPDCVLFFRMGDFYEMFDEDAVTAHRALGITLTERTKGVPMAGVPYAVYLLSIANATNTDGAAIEARINAAAEKAGITVVAIARGDAFEVFTHTHRISG